MKNLEAFSKCVHLRKIYDELDSIQLYQVRVNYFIEGTWDAHSST
jgi:hypothetical protein